MSEVTLPIDDKRVGDDGNEQQAQFDFSVRTFLEERGLAPDYVMIEMGHDAVPVAFMQPFEFTGERLYIGIEAWLRDLCGKEKSLHESKANSTEDRNIVFINNHTGSELRYDYDSGDTWLTGDYDASTVLPPGIANEVFISNVIGDPHIAYDSNKVKSVLTEASRLLRPKGVLVLRETITPDYATWALKRDLDSVNGIDLASEITLFEPGWSRLEQVYKGDPYTPYPYDRASQYRFLLKV